MNSRLLSPARRLLAVIGLALLGGAEPVLAFSFSINPVSVTLSGKRASALINLTSQSPEPVRIQVTAYEWSESPDGTARLEPTEDLLVFPPIATLPAGGTRAIRVGAVAAVAATEKSYRLYIEELPPEESKPRPGEVKVRARFGVPVFLAPMSAQPELRLEGLGVEDGKVRLSIENTGNVHARLRRVVVRAADTAGGALFEKEVTGWYLLAGGARRYDVALDPAACRRSASVSVEILSDAGKLDGTLHDLAGGCGR